MSVNCLQCDAQLEPEDLFCNECGCKVDSYESARTMRMTAPEVAAHKPVVSLDSEISKTVELSPPEDASGTVHYDSRAKDQAVFYSDCSHFSLEWNQGASVFLTDAMSSFQFRVTPLTTEASKATDFIFYLRFPGDNTFKSCDPRFHRLRTSRTVNINYRPEASNMGISQNVDLHFAYRIDGVDFCYDQQLLIDIYPQSEQSDKVLENLTIKISDIKQEGHAGDHQLNVLKGLDLSHKKTSIFKLLDMLKQAELWVPLELYQGLPIRTPQGVGMYVPPAPKLPHHKLILECDNGAVIYLFSKYINVGRSKNSDMVMRHEPNGDLSLDDCKKINLKVSSRHCLLGLDSKGAWVADKNSTNGTYLDGDKVTASQYYIEKQKEYQLSLASPLAKPYNMMIFLRVYLCPDEYVKSKSKNNTAGVVIKRTDYDSEVYLLVNSWLPLASALPDSGNYFISFRDNNFGLTDGKSWYWLNPDIDDLPPGCRINRVLNNF
jgi:FHA domain